jgi:hypothetical protein
MPLAEMLGTAADATVDAAEPVVVVVALDFVVGTPVAVDGCATAFACGFPLASAGSGSAADATAAVGATLTGTDEVDGVDVSPGRGESDV